MQDSPNLPYDSYIWKDIAIMTEGFSQKIKNELYLWLYKVQNPQDWEEIGSFLIDFYKKLEFDEILVSKSDKTLFIRFLCRILEHLDRNSFYSLIEGITFDDIWIKILKLYSYSIGFSGLNQKEILERVIQLLKNHDYKSDPEGDILFLWTIRTKLLYSMKFGSEKEIYQNITEARQFYQRYKTNRDHCLLYGIILQEYCDFFLLNQGDSKSLETVILEMEKVNNFTKSFFLDISIAMAWGDFYDLQGILQKAISYFQEYRTISQNAGFKMGIYWGNLNLARTYYRLGALTKSLNLLSLAETIYKQANSIFEFQESWINARFAEVYHALGNYQIAEEYAIKSLEKFDLNTIPIISNRNIQTIMNCFLSTKKFQKVEELLQILQSDLEKRPSHRRSMVYYLYQGKLARIEQQYEKAHHLLMNALNYAIQVRSVIKQLEIRLELADLFLQKFQETQNLQDLSKLEQFLETILLAAHEYQYHYLYAKAIILQSILKQIQGDSMRALRFLHLAEQELNNHPDELQMIQKKIDEIQLQNHPISGNLQQNLLSEALLELSQSFIRVQANPPRKLTSYNIQGVVVISGGGMPIYQNFLDKTLAQKPQLVSNLLSAIDSFSKGVFNQNTTGSLKSIKHENMEILLENYEDRLIAVISDKDTLELRSKMMQFSNSVFKVKPSEKNHDISFNRTELDKLVKNIFETGSETDLNLSKSPVSSI